MLTPKENFIETIKGGRPDRFVNQFEYVNMIFDPIVFGALGTITPGDSAINNWGVTIVFPEGAPGPMPVHTHDKIVIKDITNWKNEIRMQDPHSIPPEAWIPFDEMSKRENPENYLNACLVGPGILDKTHYHMGMEGALISFLAEPKAMHELIDYFTEWEIECARIQIDRYRPDALFHHDDWGSQSKLLISPTTFREFIAPAYKRIYGFWRSKGVDIIIHHSDSYAADLVPDMIDLGIDVWQGAVSENNIPELLRKYGGKISIQGGIDNGKYDVPDWTKEKIQDCLKTLFETAGSRFLIPSFTSGMAGTYYSGAYDAASEAIDYFSKIYFM